MVRALAALFLAAGLAGCDDAASIIDSATGKGGTDVPEEARGGIDPETRDALGRRIEHQNFN